MLVKYSDIEEVVFLGNVLYVPTVHSPLITRAICARSPPSVGPSVVRGLTLVGMLSGGAGPWPGWLPGSEPSGSC